MLSGHSPLFVPVLWEGDHFRVLDETLLPWKTEYIEVRNLSDALRAVGEMKTRAFGQVLTFFYAAALLVRNHEEVQSEPLRVRLAELTEAFSQARPTFDFRGLGKYFDNWLGELARAPGVAAKIEGKIHETVAWMVQTREERARRVAEVLPDSTRLLTHCNISGELVAVARWCREMNKKIQIYATETRPYLQGTRLTSWEVRQAGFEVALVPDAAIGQLMAKDEVDAVLVGSDRCAQNGDIVNKVGTYPLALMAREYEIPFYALVQYPRSLLRGEDVEIEQRPVSELLTFQGRSLGPKGIQGFYPAFDVTPASLIVRLFGFDGTFTPKSFSERYSSPLGKVEKREKKSGDSFLLLYGIPGSGGYDHLAHCLKMDQADAILVPEMRPEMWGPGWVSEHLVERGIRSTLVSDNMMGTLFAQGRVRRLFLFYEELKESGPMGICGSLLAAHLAREHGVPIELLQAGP